MRAKWEMRGQLSGRVYSRYHRTLSGLPWAGLLVCFQISVRKFYCANTGCSGKVFAERLDDVAKPYGRRTARQQEALEAIAFDLGGEAGAKLAARLGIGISRDTLLRCIRRAPEPQVLTPVVLGVADWDWKKRYHYGTILVDLEGRHAVDLLPDRSIQGRPGGVLAKSLDHHQCYAQASYALAGHHQDSLTLKTVAERAEGY